MVSLTTAFNRAADHDREWTYMLLLWMLFIDNDRQDDEKEARRKHLASKRPRRKRKPADEPGPRFRKPKPPAPRPF